MDDEPNSRHRRATGRSGSPGGSSDVTAWFSLVVAMLVPGALLVSVLLFTVG